MKTCLPFQIGAICAIALILTACNNPEGDFKKAEQANTEPAYQDFIKQHPDSPLVAQAQADLEKVVYSAAKREGSTSAFEKFLSRFPKSPLTNQAQEDLENIEYAEAKRIGTIPAYQEFLQQFAHNGKLTEQAKSTLEALEFEELTKSATIPAWESFIRKYPLSTNASIAQQELARLVLLDITTSNTVSAYEGFVKRFAGTDTAKEALRRIAMLDYQTATNANDIEGYQEFIIKHSDCEFIGDVKQRLEGQLEDRDWNKALLNNKPDTYLSFSVAHPNSGRVHVVQGTLKESIGGSWGSAGLTQMVLLEITDGGPLSETISVKEAVKLKVVDYVQIEGLGGLVPSNRSLQCLIRR
jgi:outer membrane protein assembly factor BamD (BamD/ComL family)